MRSLVSIAAGLALTVAALAGAEEASSDAARLEAGEIIVTSTDVPGYPLPRAKAVAVIEAPPPAVWAIVQDCGSYSRTMPRVLVSEELERNGDHIHCRQTIDMPFPFSDLVSDTDVVHTISPDGWFKREWRLRGGDFKANQGSWTLEPRAAGAATLVTYEALMEPNVSIPNWIIESAQKITLPSMIEGLRKQVAQR